VTHTRARPPAPPRAFTLIEIIVVIIILGVLATLIVPRIMGRIGQSKTSVALANAQSLAKQVRIAMADIGGTLPPGATIDLLWEKPSDVEAANWKGPYVDNPAQLDDPWGRRFILIVPGSKNVDFDVVSYGSDGQPGGQDESQDVTAP